jgi:hypothetical protein
LGNALLLGHSVAEFSFFSVFSHGFSQTPTRYHGKEVKRRQGVLKSKMPVATCRWHFFNLKNATLFAKDKFHLIKYTKTILPVLYKDPNKATSSIREQVLRDGFCLLVSH